MTNFLVLLMIGGSLGWLATAWSRPFSQSDMLANLIAGALASFSAGLAANGQGLYAGLSAAGLAGSVAGAGAAIGLLALIRRQHRH